MAVNVVRVLENGVISTRFELIAGTTENQRVLKLKSGVALSAGDSPVTYITIQTEQDGRLFNKIFPIAVSSATITPPVSAAPSAPTVPSSAIGYDFIVNETQPERLQDVIFILTGATANSYVWDFGDGTTSAGITNSLRQLTKSYTAPGPKTVSLTVNGNQIVTKTNYLTIISAKNPVYDFTVNNTTPDTGETVSFAATQSANTYNWYFGDGTTVGGNQAFKSVNKSYSTAGLKNVTLTLNSATSVVKNNLILVSARPNYDFSVANNVIDVNGSATFTATVTASNYQWDFDNNGTFDSSGAGLKTVSFTFTSAGRYSPRLRSFSNATTDVTKANLLLVRKVNNVTVNNSNITQGSSVVLTASLTADSYRWDLNNDGVFEISGNGNTFKSISYTASALGNNTIRLDNTFSDGVGSYTNTIVKSNLFFVSAIPVYDFTISNTVIDINNSATFTASISASNYQWDFDNNGTFDSSGSRVVSFTFTSAGRYSPRLRSFSNATTDVTKANLLLVRNVNDVTTLQSIYEEGDTITLTATVTADRYQWDINNNGTIDISGVGQTFKSISYTASAKGTFSVNLISFFNDALGGYSTNIIKNNLFTVLSSKPEDTIFDFTVVSSNPFINQQVTFTATQSANTYNWYFGDGTSGSGRIINKTYTSAGLYSVVLINNSAQTVTKNNFINAVSAKPENTIFDFIVSNSSAKINISRTFTATQSANTYNWYFGDGTSGSGRIINKTYTSAGLYSVVLINNSAQTVTKNNFINAKPSLDFNITDVYGSIITSSSNIPLNGYATFTVSGSQANSYVWNLGDGTIISGNNSSFRQITHQYTSANIYDVSLFFNNDETITKNNIIQIVSGPENFVRYNTFETNVSGITTVGFLTTTLSRDLTIVSALDPNLSANNSKLLTLNNSDGFTISFWFNEDIIGPTNSGSNDQSIFYWTHLNEGNLYSTLIVRYREVDANTWLDIVVNSSAATPNPFVSNSSPLRFNLTSANRTLPTGAKHVLVSYNNSTREIRSSVNNNSRLVGYTSATWNFGINTGSNSNIVTTQYIGTGGDFKCDMQEIFFDNKYLDLTDQNNINKFYQLNNFETKRPKNLGISGLGIFNSSPILYFNNGFYGNVRQNKGRFNDSSYDNSVFDFGGDVIITDTSA